MPYSLAWGSSSASLAITLNSDKGVEAVKKHIPLHSKKEMESYLLVNEHMDPEVNGWSQHKALWRAHKDLHFLSDTLQHSELSPFKRLWINEAEIPKHGSRDGKLTLWDPRKTCTARSTWGASFLKLEALFFSRFRHRFNIQQKFLETKPKRKPERDSLCHLQGIRAWVLMTLVKILF